MNATASTALHQVEGQYDPGRVVALAFEIAGHRLPAADLERDALIRVDAEPLVLVQPDPHGPGLPLAPGRDAFGLGQLVAVLPAAVQDRPADHDPPHTRLDLWHPRHRHA